MNKILSCMIIYFALHQTVWGVSPASCDDQNIKLHDYFFSRYIKLFEVCHPPVVMIKILSCRIISFRLYQTVWGVSPASCDELNIKLYDYFFALHETVWGVSPASCDDQNIKLHDYFFFRVTLNCLRCATRQLWWTYEAAWLFLSGYIKLFDVCYPPATGN